MIGEFHKLASHRFTIRKVLRLELRAIGGEDELGLVLRAGRAFPQGGERGRHVARRAGGEVDIVPLQHAAGKVGLIGGAFALCLEALEGGGFVAKSFEKREGERGGIEIFLRKGGDGFFDFNSVYGWRK